MEDEETERYFNSDRYCGGKLSYFSLISTVACSNWDPWKMVLHSPTLHHQQLRRDCHCL